MSSWLRPPGITLRLLLIAIVPAALMFVAVTATLYKMALDDARREMLQQGRLIASALAHSSRYGLVSGNLPSLRASLQPLLQEESGIVCIAILGESQQTLLQTCSRAADAPDTQSIEAPIQLERLPELESLVDGSEENGAAVPSLPPERGSSSGLRTIGHVRVTMSIQPQLQARMTSMAGATGLVLMAAIASGIVGLVLSRRLGRTLHDILLSLRGIRRGEFDVRFKTIEAGELGELQRTIQQMATSLDEARHGLESQVEQRTRELKDAVDRVRKADAEKRRLIAHSNAMVETDRKRVAVEIHDHLGASLISVRLEASALLARAQAAGDDDGARMARRISDTVQSLYQSTRNIVRSLRPELIDTLGLQGAIEDMVRHLDDLQSGCRFAFRCPSDIPAIPSDTSIAVYRVIQEACTNIAKHAQATQAIITLDVLNDQQLLRITIKDNGCGFDPRTLSTPGLGLIGMSERAAAVAGQLSVTSRPGLGTTITLGVPLPAQSAASTGP